MPCVLLHPLHVACSDRRCWASGELLPCCRVACAGEAAAAVAGVVETAPPVAPRAFGKEPLVTLTEFQHLKERFRGPSLVARLARGVLIRAGVGKADSPSRHSGGASGGCRALREKGDVRQVAGEVLRCPLTTHLVLFEVVVVFY